MMKQVMLIVIIVGITLTVWVKSAPQRIAYGQGETEVHCGQELDVEFTGDVQEHLYSLSIEPRWSFDVSVMPFGDDLQTVIAIYGPTDNLIRVDNANNITAGVFAVSKTPTVSSGVVSSRGPYKIRVANTAITVGELDTRPVYFGGTGYYTFKLGCTKDDGTKIKPGDDISSTVTPELLQTATTRPAQPSQTPSTSESSSESTFSFLTTGQSYEVTFGSQTKIIKLIELTDAGWAKIEVNGGIGWLNLYQVALIIPLD